MLEFTPDGPISGTPPIDAGRLHDGGAAGRRGSRRSVVACGMQRYLLVVELELFEHEQKITYQWGEKGHLSPFFWARTHLINQSVTASSTPLMEGWVKKIAGFLPVAIHIFGHSTPLTKNTRLSL